MNFEEMLNKNLEEYSKRNYEDLIDNIDSYSDKIKKFVAANKDLGFTDDIIKKEIKSKNPYVIAAIRKDPVRQNISENTFFEYLDIEKAAAGGKNAIRFDNDGNFSTDTKTSTKSADFVLENSDGDIVYGTQKYIKESGGAQDNQIKDAKSFAKYGSKKNKIIIAVDGEYGISKLKSANFNSNVEVLTTDEILVKLNNGELKKHTTLHN